MKTNNSKIVYSSGSVSLMEFETVRGKRVLLDMGGDAVMIVPYTAHNTYILTSQKRVGNDVLVYEFPSGGIKEGENPEEAAKRELLEETGATGRLKFITKVEPLSGLVKFNLYIFSAQVNGVSESDKVLEEHEYVSTVELDKKELIKKIKSFEKVDGYLILGLGVLELLNAGTVAQSSFELKQER